LLPKKPPLTEPATLLLSVALTLVETMLEPTILPEALKPIWPPA